MITKGKLGGFFVFVITMFVWLFLLFGSAYAADLPGTEEKAEEIIDEISEESSEGVMVQNEGDTEVLPEVHTENHEGQDAENIEALPEKLPQDHEGQDTENKEALPEAVNQDYEESDLGVSSLLAEPDEQSVSSDNQQTSAPEYTENENTVSQDAAAEEDKETTSSVKSVALFRSLALTKESVEETSDDPAEEEDPPKPFVRPLKDGTYVIVSKLNGFKALQTEGGSKDAGKQIEVRDCDGSDTQKFKLASDAATGYYSITNVRSGKNLAVKGDSAKAGTSVVQNAASSSLGQKWILVEKGGYYELQSALDGTPLLLTLKNGSTGNGTDAVLEEAKEAASQLFSFLISKPSVKISEGVYEINSALNSNMKLDISGANMNDKGNLQIYKSNGTNAQKFIVSKAGGNQYTITSYNSGKAVDLTGASKAAKANVQQYTKNGTAAQKWTIRNVGDGTLYITSAVSGLPIEVKDSKAANKTNIYVNKASGSKAQKFTFTKVADSKLKPIANGVYLIQSAKNTNRVVAVEDGSRLQRANIQLQYNDNASFQKFKFIYAGNGYYKIQNVKSKHMIDLKDASYANKANIQQWHDNGNQAQLWLPHKNSDGSYTFISAKSSRVLDAAGASTADCTNIWAYSFNNTAAQKFRLAKTSGSDNTAINYGTVKADPVLSAMYKKAQDYNSDTNYLVLCNITKHRVVLFKKSEGRWLSDMTTAATVGSPYTPTPTGTFTVYNHWEYFDGGFGEPGSAYRCWWSTCFYGSYYFHSIIYYYNTGYPGRVMDGTLNANISHGCVRLPVDKAKYLYDHSPIGTKVRVYK